MIKDPHLFVGRKREMRWLQQKMTGVQPVSCCIWASRRMGKSSLLFQFYLTWGERTLDPARYVVGYLDLQGVPCDQVKDFYRQIAAALAAAATHRPELVQSMAHVQDRAGFAQALQEWREVGVLAVLCLDEFGTLCEQPGLFDDNFFNNLRALLNDSLLMLVLATLDPMSTLQKEGKYTSSFFNLTQGLELKAWQEEEVSEFLRRPSLGTGKDDTPCLSAAEQQLAREWGGNHPYALQLAASCLFAHRHDGGDKQARACFEAQISGNPSLGGLWRLRHLPLPNALGGLLLRIWGQLARWGAWFSRAKKPVVAFLFFVFVMSAVWGGLSGQLTWEKVFGLVFNQPASK